MLEIFTSCVVCGNGLNTPDINMCDDASMIIMIEPCKTCLDREEEKAQKAGHKDGYSEGFDNGRAERG